MNFKEMYIEAMKQEAIGNERRADIVREIRSHEERSVRPVRRPLLTVAIVAGLAAALAVTAVAAVRFGIVEWTREDGEKRLDITQKVLGEGELSPEAQDRVENAGPRGKVDHQHFDSWQALQDYVGVDLLDNTYLDGYPAVDHGVVGGYDACFDSDLVVVSRYHQVGEMEVEVMADIDLGDQGSEVQEVAKGDGEYYPYTLSDGTEVQVPHAEPGTPALGFPMVVDGICYVVMIYDWPEGDETPTHITDEAVRTILDGFVFN